MTENAYEMIDALVDGERVDAEVLKRALADANGRDYLVDILALRDAMAQTSPKSQPDAAPERPRTAWHRAIAWPAAAAVLVASLAAGFSAGYQFAGAPAEPARSTDVSSRAVGPGPAPPGSTAPAPTRVIRLESGVDWQEGTGGN